MATKSPRVAVTFTVDSTGYTAAVNKAKAQMIDFGEASKRVSHGMITDVQATSGALRIIDGGIQNNIRSAERFLASIKGVGAAMQFIYPGVGLIAVGALIARGVTELTAFIKKTREAGQVFRDSLQEMQNASRLNNDELARTNVELENQIAKLTGKHENVLAGQLIEARVEADKLTISAAAAAKQMKELLDKSQAGLLAQIMGSAPTGEVFGNINNFQNLKKGAEQDKADALHRGDKAAADAAQAHYEQLLKNERAYLQGQIADRSQKRMVTKHIFTGPGQPGYDIEVEDKDQTRNLDALHAALGLNYDQSDRIDLATQHGKDDAAVKKIQDAQNYATKAREAAARLMKQYGEDLAQFTGSLMAGPGEEEEQFRARMLTEEALFWAQKLSVTRKGTEAYKEIQEKLAEVDRQANQQAAQAQNEAIKLAEARNKFIESSFGDDLDLSRAGNLEGANQGKDVAAMLAGMNESVAIGNKTADAWSEAKIQIGLAAGTMSKYDAAAQTAALHTEQHERALAAIAAQREALDRRYGSPNTAEARAAYEQLNNQAAQLAGQFQVQQAQDRQGVISQTGLGAWKQALDQFVQQSRDTAAQVRDIWSSALSSVNEEIVKIISSRHNYGVRREFGNLGAAMFRNVAGAGLQKAEGALLGGFGFGGKPDGSESNPLHVILAGSKHAIAGAGPAVSGMVKSAVSDTGGFLGTLGSFATKIFSGLGFADGGMPPVGMASLVGENGPELFVPKVAGTVMPSGSFGGDTHHHSWTIDARGATDPAAVNQAVMRGIAKAMPQIAAGVTRAQQGSHSRMPPSRRF